MPKVHGWIKARRQCHSLLRTSGYLAPGLATTFSEELGDWSVPTKMLNTDPSKS